MSAVKWPTPRANDGEKRGQISENPRNGLPGMVMNWPTPTANEDAAVRPGSRMQKMLGNHPEIRGSGGGALNPTWVEWLQGWPLGWTRTGPMPPATWGAWASAFRIAPPDCAASATDKSPPLS